MRLVIQRITEGRVKVQGREICRVGSGLCLFLGIARGDTEEDAKALARKTVELRIFEDDRGRLDRSLLDLKGDLLIVSEFTLYGDCSKGRRPSFSRAAPPAEAERLYRYFTGLMRAHGLRVATGQFQAKMEVTLNNDGPVTFILDSE